MFIRLTFFFDEHLTFLFVIGLPNKWKIKFSIEQKGPSCLVTLSVERTLARIGVRVFLESVVTDGPTGRFVGENTCPTTFCR